MSTALLKAAAPASASADALQESQDAYFSELLSYSLERLAKEPELLRVDQEQIRRSIQVRLRRGAVHRSSSQE